MTLENWGCRFKDLAGLEGAWRALRMSGSWRIKCLGLWRDFVQHQEFEGNWDSGLWGLQFVWKDWKVSSSSIGVLGDWEMLKEFFGEKKRIHMQRL